VLVTTSVSPWLFFRALRASVVTPPHLPPRSN